MEISTPDAVAWVRARPQQFFPSGTPEPVYLLAYAMADVVGLSAGSCTIRRHEDWWIIGSEVDWLRHDEYTPTDLFSHVVPAPSHGQHSMRAEVILSAFATNIWIILGSERQRIVGSDPSDAVWAVAAGLHRAVIFSL
jgi:hypothetical protein